MNSLKLLPKVFFAGVLTFSTNAYARVTPAERDEAQDETTREMKQDIHRTEEKMCQRGDAKCAKYKVKHRAQETKDYTKDKAKETKERINEIKD